MNKKRATPILSERMRIDTALKDIQRFGVKFKSIGLDRWTRDLRKRLHMTQKQLAKRAKITQSQLSKIEAGKTKITLETLEKILGALFCDLLILPLPQHEIEVVLKKQAYLAAKKKLTSLYGSMALEEQIPSKEYLEKKVAEVADDLIRSGSQMIWNI